jgi:hypothetical protein
MTPQSRSTRVDSLRCSKAQARPELAFVFVFTKHQTTNAQTCCALRPDLSCATRLAHRGYGAPIFIGFCFVIL